VSVKLERVKDTTVDALTDMILKAKTPRAFFSRVIYPEYKKAQVERWQTENTSQGEHWVPLNPTYSKYKKTRFAAYPYGGTRMLVATGKLLKSITGEETRDHVAIFTDSSMTVGTSLDYAAYVADTRPIVEFDEAMIDHWVEMVQNFIAGD